MAWKQITPDDVLETLTDTGWKTMLAWFNHQHTLPFKGVLIEWKLTQAQNELTFDYTAMNQPWQPNLL